MNGWFFLVIIGSCIYSTVIVVHFMLRRSKLKSRIVRLKRYAEEADRACIEEEVLCNATQTRVQNLNEIIEGLIGELENLNEACGSARQRAHPLNITRHRKRLKKGTRSETYGASERLPSSLKRAMARINKDIPVHAS